MFKLFGPSLCLTLWSLGLPLWQALGLVLGAHAILFVVRARSIS